LRKEKLVFMGLVTSAIVFYLLGPGFLPEKMLVAGAASLPVLFGVFTLVAFNRVYSPLDAVSKEKRVWVLLLLGMGLWVFGEFLRVAQEVFLGAQLPYPSIADAFWLLGYPFLIAGLMLKTNYVVPKDRLTELNFAWFIASLLVIGGLSFGAPNVFSIDASNITKTLNLVYAMGDFMLFFSCILIALFFSAEELRFNAQAFARSWVIMAMGFALIVIYDVLFAYLRSGNAYASGNPIDLTYVLGYGIVGLGAFMRSYLPEVE